MLEYKCAFHYVTDSPKKIIDSYRRMEARCTKEAKEWVIYSDILQKMVGAEKCTDDEVRARIEKCMMLTDMEDVIFLISGPVLSVFPVLETDRQFNRKHWSYFETGKKSLAQKTACLRAFKSNEAMYLTFFSQGIERASMSKNQIVPMAELLSQHFSLRGADINEIEKKLSELKAHGDFDELSECLGFPLVLPDDWKQRWDRKPLSRHTFLASEKQE